MWVLPPSSFAARLILFPAGLLLPVADLTLFDEHGNKTSVPNKERQMEALQLLLQLLPPANRSLLRLLLDLLHHTARQQDKNKMSAFNLALMFAPHLLWPRHVRRSLLSGGGAWLGPTCTGAPQTHTCVRF